MKQSLASPLPKYVHTNAGNFKIKPTFGRVLTCYEILQDEVFDDLDKIILCLRLLVRNKIKLLFLRSKQKIVLFEAIFKEIISINDDKRATIKSFDFIQDSQYIYAGFMQCYGIDLFKQRDTLHWWEFLSLFSGISSDTRIAQIINIRTQPIPKLTKYNAEERARIMKLKNEYRLEMTEKERQENLAQGLIKIVKTLEGMSKRER